MALATGAMSAATHPRRAHEHKYDRNIHYEVNLRPEQEAGQVFASAPRKAKKAPVWDKLNVYMLILLAGVLGIFCVVTNTWANEAQKEINQMRGNTKELREDIEELVIRINRSLDVKSIEARATEELGMGYPLPEQYVYLENTPEIADFRQYIKEGAHNPFKDRPLQPLRAVSGQTAETWEALSQTLAAPESQGSPLLEGAGGLGAPVPAGR